MSDKNNDLDDGLTEQERAALQEEDDTTSVYEDPEQQDGGEADPPAAEKKDDEPAGDEPAADEQPEPSEDSKEQAPILVAQVPEDIDAKLKEIEGKKDALLQQFDDGDITAREYEKQRAELEKQERAIEFAQFEAKLADRMNQQRLENEWKATCNSFLAENPIYREPRLYRALDQEVRDLAAKPETANWSGQKFLEEAHKNLAQAFNLQTQKQAKPKGVDRELPPNLAKVPAAEIEETSGGRFAVLDRLAATDPIGYEETLAKMSQADRDAYLAA